MLLIPLFNITAGAVISAKMWHEYYEMDLAIRYFTVKMPSIFDQRGMEYVGGRVNPSVVSVTTSARGAALTLHNATAQSHAMAYQKCLDAAREVVSVVQEIRDVDFPMLHIVLRVCICDHVKSSA